MRCVGLILAWNWCNNGVSKAKSGGRFVICTGTKKCSNGVEFFATKNFRILWDSSDVPILKFGVLVLKFGVLILKFEVLVYNRKLADSECGFYKTSRGLLVTLRSTAETYPITYAHLSCAQGRPSIYKAFTINQIHPSRYDMHILQVGYQEHTT